MRYVPTLMLASMSAMRIAFLMEWRDVFAMLAAMTAILIGLPVLSLASNFWFGETQLVHHDEDYGSPGATARDN